MNFKEKYAIAKADSPEVKAGKQAMLDLYDAAVKAASEAGLKPDAPEFKAAVEAELKARDEKVKSLEAELVRLAAKADRPVTVAKSVKTFTDELVEAIQAKAEDLKAYMTGQKSVVTIGVGNTINDAGSDSQVTISENTGIISQLRDRVRVYLQNVSTGSIGNQYAIWIEETDEQGTPIFIAEAATKTQLSVQYLEKRKQVKKIGVTGKITYELMQDLPQLVSFIQNNLVKRVSNAIEDQLFNGNDTGANLAGLIGYASAFTGGTLAGTLPNTGEKVPNNYDVIRAIALQVFEAFGQANAIFVDAGKLAEMEIAKDADGQYIMPPFSAANGSVIAGVRLIPTTSLPDGTDFVGGDLSVINVMFREGLTVQIGESGEDFRDNLKTIKVEQRLVQFVSANDTQVLVKGTFAAAKTTLQST